MYDYGQDFQFYHKTKHKIVDKTLEKINVSWRKSRPHAKTPVNPSWYNKKQSEKLFGSVMIWTHEHGEQGWPWTREHREQGWCSGWALIFLSPMQASHQCGPGSIPGLGVKCGLSLLLVLVLALRGFSPGTPVFPSPQKPTSPNSNWLWKAPRGTSQLNMYLYLFNPSLEDSFSYHN